MRFQTTETVQTPDSEIVLRALEATLPEISSEVVRDGHRITLRGLGPSPRARNPRDITILHVSSDGAATVIHADVTFQASALLGAASQDPVVRSKLDYVFDQVRSQLNLEVRRGSMSELVPHSGVFAPKIDLPVAEPHHRPPTKFAGQESAWQEPPARREPIDRGPVAERVAEAMRAAAESPSPAPAAERAPVVLDPPAEPGPAKPLPVVERVSRVPVSPVETAAAPAAVPAQPRPERPMLQFSSSQRAHRTHVPALITAIVALLLLFAVAAYYLLRPNPPDPTPTSLPAETQPANQSSLFAISSSGAGSGALPSVCVISQTYR